MFDIDRWQEVLTSIRKNLLRTILAGSTIAMGLYIFILLFGIGNGLQNGFLSQFVDDAANSISIRSRRTTKAYGGYQEGRQVEFKNKHYDLVNKDFADDIEYSTARRYDNVSARYKNEYGSYSVRAVHPDHEYIEKTEVIKGRYLNESDLKNRSKHLVIGRLVESDLFKGKTAIGKFLTLDGLNFRVIGVFQDESGDDEERTIYLPITTQQTLDKGTDVINQINLTYKPGMPPDAAVQLGDKIEKTLQKQLTIHPADNSALRINNSAENMGETFQFLFVLTIIVFFIGIGTLIAGIIGISNIMIYIVKERTKEIGIRKALGAKPASIVGLILHESILITLFSGIIGVLLAILTLHLLGDSLEKFFILNPGVETFHIVSALFVLVSGGIFAGFVPARRASKIKPIEALRTE